MIQIPLRFQIINGLSPLQAGIRLLPFAVLLPVGSVFAAGIAGKAKVPPLYLFIAASILQIIGFALLSTSPTDGHLNPAQYGYQVICGFAIGSVLATLTVMTPFSVETRDKGNPSLELCYICSLNKFSCCYEFPASVSSSGGRNRSFNRHGCYE
jgi:hypothetical protein